MPGCKSLNKMFVLWLTVHTNKMFILWLIVHTLWNQLLLQLLLDLSKLCTYVTDIVKLRMWEFNAEKVLFDKLAGFLTLAILWQLHLVNDI